MELWIYFNNKTKHSNPLIMAITIISMLISMKKYIAVQYYLVELSVRNEVSIFRNEFHALNYKFFWNYDQYNSTVIYL